MSLLQPSARIVFQEVNCDGVVDDTYTGIISGIFGYLSQEFKPAKQRPLTCESEMKRVRIICDCCGSLKKS
jgi:hypothetical protein